MADTTRTLPRAGLTNGAVVWFAGVAAAVLLLVLFSDLGSDPLSLLATGVVFYYAFHLWPAVPVLTAGNAIFAVFAPVSMLLLFWAGFRTTVGTDASPGVEAFRRGATVVTGYFPLSVLCLPAFGFSVERSPLADPLVTVAIVGITGFAFPIVFGGLGGWVAGR